MCLEGFEEAREKSDYGWDRAPYGGYDLEVRRNADGKLLRLDSALIH